MPSIRCEELRYAVSKGPSGIDDQSDTAVIEFIGDGNTTTSTPAASAVVFGPALRAMNVLVRSLRGQAYVTFGDGTPVATAANSALIDIDGEAAIELDKGQSIAALAAIVS
jgi:hypothetical protein